MSTKVNRRELGRLAAGAAAAARVSAIGPTVLVQKRVRPVVIASANGHIYRNGGAAPASRRHSRC